MTSVPRPPRHAFLSAARGRNGIFSLFFLRGMLYTEFILNEKERAYESQGIQRHRPS